MQQDNIQWFPGHMAKTRRLIAENLKLVDIVIEVLDARIPYSSRNPEIPRLIGEKPTLILLNKATLADKKITAEWQKYYTKKGAVAIPIDCLSGEGIHAVEAEIKKILSAKLERYENKGMVGRTLKAMIVGIPNVGKSSLINRICGTKKVKVEDRPGVTLNKQWVPTKIGLDLMDMPGVLWPKFDDPRTGEALAMTGAIRDAILDTEHIAMLLCGRLRHICPELFCARYKIDPKVLPDFDDYELFQLVGRKRGFLVSGGEVDTERTSKILLDEFRGGKIGPISLEMPPKSEG